MSDHSAVIVGMPRHGRAVIVITALRSALAFGIGVALLLIPDRGESALAGFMGAYFLVSGLFSLAWARRGPMLNRLAFVAGVIGVLAGSAILAYVWTDDPVPPRDLVLMLMGLVIGLTGVLHVVGGFVVGERMDRWPTGHVLLGALEILLAIILLLAPFRRDLIDVTATVWAFTAGSVLALDAVHIRRRLSRTARADQSSVKSSGSA